MGDFFDNITPDDKVFAVLISRVSISKELILEHLYNKSIEYIQDKNDISLIIQGVDKAIAEFIEEYNTQQNSISKFWKDSIGITY